MNALRWILVLPAGIVAAVLISIPIHLVVMATFGGWNSEPMIEIGDPNALATIERFAQSLLAPAAFIVAGAWTAPTKRLPVSVGLAVILAVGFVTLVIVLGDQVSIHPLQFALHAVSLIGGASLIRWKCRTSSSAV